MKQLFFVLSIACALVITFTTGCYKKPGPGTGEIKVLDSAGVIQKKVHVKMFCTQTGCVVVREGLTDSRGHYTQEFEEPVVLRVRAVRYDTTITEQGLPPNVIEKISVDSLCGEGFITIENDERATEEITILECR